MPDLNTEASNLIAAAEAVDAATPAFSEALAGLQEAEANMRKALTDARKPKRDHIGGAQLPALAMNLARGTGELAGTPLAEVARRVYGDLAEE